MMPWISPCTSRRPALRMSARERRGLVPELLERLMAQRDHHKAERSRSEASGDAEGAAFHDRLQEAVKIPMNSFYGVFASEFYRFTHRDLGSSITAWARHNIKEIIRKVEDEGHPVVYSDTDSIFVRAPIGPEVPPILEDDGDASSWLDARASLIEFGMDLAKRHTRDGAVLEFLEKALSVFFLHGEETLRREGDLAIGGHDRPGYETQRTDSFRALTEGMMETLRGDSRRDHEAAIAGAIARIQSVRSGNMDPRAGDLEVLQGHGSEGWVRGFPQALREPQWNGTCSGGPETDRIEPPVHVGDEDRLCGHERRPSSHGGGAMARGSSRWRDRRLRRGVLCSPPRQGLRSSDGGLRLDG